MGIHILFRASPTPEPPGLRWGLQEPAGFVGPGLTKALGGSVEPGCLQDRLLMTVVMNS